MSVVDRHCLPVTWSYGSIIIPRSKTGNAKRNKIDSPLCSQLDVPWPIEKQEFEIFSTHQFWEVEVFAEWFQPPTVPGVSAEWIGPRSPPKMNWLCPRTLLNRVGPEADRGWGRVEQIPSPVSAEVIEIDMERSSSTTHGQTKRNSLMRVWLPWNVFPSLVQCIRPFFF